MVDRADINQDAIDVSELVEKAKYGQWEKVFPILDRKPNLINCIPEDRAWGVLHQAAWWQDEGTVKRLLKYPTCDSEIKTKQDRANHGPDKTPKWIAETLKGNKEIANILLRFHANKRNKRFGGDIPTYATYKEGEKIDHVGPPLLVLALANYKITFLGRQSKINVGTAFKEILNETFRYEIRESHWKHAMEKICYSMGAFDKDAAELLSTDSNPSTDCTEKDAEEHRFFARVIKLYSKNHVYHQVNESLRRQSLPITDGQDRYKPTADDFALAPYSLFLDVLLFYWEDLTKVSTVTYRGVHGMKYVDLSRYTEGTRFVWLTFVSSSKSRDIAKGFAIEETEETVAKGFSCNVLFEISNDTPGTEFWRPRDLEHAWHDLHEYKHEQEALYPAGAEFKVMKVRDEGSDDTESDATESDAKNAAKSGANSDDEKPLKVIELQLMNHST